MADVSIRPATAADSQTCFGVFRRSLWDLMRRIDPFCCLFLTDGPWAKLDRHLPFNPCLML